MKTKSFLGKLCLMAIILSIPWFTNAQVTPPATPPPAPATTPAPAVRVRPVAGPRVPPVPLRPDVKVEHVMTIGPKALRLVQNPITGDMWYINFDGDVYMVKNFDTKQAVSKKVLTFQDHGIKPLQGIAFLKNTLFLSGNFTTNNGIDNHGRLVRYDMTNPDKPVMSVVFNTVAYGTNIGTFDHGWNALKVSLDGKYLFVNSGSRTDHGEVQDKGGKWPNARIGALTARIFRIPIDAKDLLLPDDEAKLKAAGYIYAEGIRNAYDMNFDGKGQLFAVSNSPDYDMPEDMFWIREGHHYGFPWMAGGIEMPQQYPDWQPDPKTDPFIPRTSTAWTRRFFHNDPDYPKIPEGVKFTPSVQNLGPDANEYRGHSGKVLDGDQTGQTISGFTPHASPLGLVFDTKNILAKDYKGHGFVIRYSKGDMFGAFSKEGGDMLTLDMEYNKLVDNYFMKVNRIAEGFKEASGAILVKNNIYVIEYGGANGGDIWKVILPLDKKATPVTKAVVKK